MKCEDICAFILLGSLLVSVLFLSKDQELQVSSHYEEHGREIALLKEEIKKKTVPHFYIQKGKVYSGSGEIVIANN